MSFWLFQFTNLSFEKKNKFFLFFVQIEIANSLNQSECILNDVTKALQ